MKRPSKILPRPEPREEDAFELDDEAGSFAGEFIEEATSAEHVAEDARNETLIEETTGDLHQFDLAILEEER